MEDFIIWLPLVLLALAALMPLAAALLRPRAARGRREADMALYRAQLAELDREREVGRLDEAGHRAATLEVQRRLIAAAEQTEGEAQAGRGAMAALVLLPLIVAAGVGLYLLRGTPGLPSATYAMRAEVQERDERLLATLRERLAALDPRSEQAWQGYVLLGNAERARGRPEAAIAAWRTALEARFDPGLAGEVAETEIERNAPAAAMPWIERGLREAPNDPRLRFLFGLAELQAGRPEAARTAWQALLADTPADAPWRAMLTQRLSSLP
ncbi:c-type cytochrome biogenesis protein CcmI [Neoroseomonas oryzicola]|uniref:C-type cytochrome biogenesis protein CcmI n=1 Tax=Neoroseomonas oryzicola TaxID=535904 RepID=A0A9X9WP90_9PROT|nr:c-type cytochrome biogenesis protein CcmI [Neoroseomonas oryzicola]MBR0662150.1 c-type cytochrome biogenesis protein CcmI [Neoroseomonas oryzicola]NKE18056.1 c-type cytochrome biogenesis protein CcmI [Neoroseomonas oryzicola]